MILPLSVVLFGVFAFFYNSILLFSPPPTPKEPFRNTLPIAELFQESDPRRAVAPDTLLFTGDMMLGRHVERLMLQEGPQYPFAHMGDVLTQPEFLIGNLEGPIPAVHQPTPDFSTAFSFSKNVPPLLAEQGFDIVTLGNNHTRDRGEEAYLHTQDILEQYGVRSLGDPLAVTDTSHLPLELRSGPTELFSINMTFPQNDPEAAREAVERFHIEYPETFLIVAIHWGAEYQMTSRSSQQDLAHRLVDAGADLIIGHHPHVVQEVEHYGDALIFYSLGNFIFDQYFSQEVQEGLLVQLTRTTDGAQYELLPVRSVRSQPSLLLGEEKGAWLQELAERSPTQADAVRTGVIAVP